MGKNLHIEGDGVSQTIIQNDYDDYNRPPLNIGKGYVKNITFRQNGLNDSNSHSYAVHIDNDDLYNNKLVFDNTNFYSHSNAAAGIGTRNNCDLAFNECVFVSDSNDESNKVGALFLHNAVNPAFQGSNQNVTINNCQLISNYQSALHLRYCGTPTNYVFIKSYNSIYKSLSPNIFIGEGVVTFDSFEGATKNIYIDNSSHGNNIEIMNAGKYNLGYRNLVGLFASDTINDSIKRYVGNGSLTTGLNVINLPFNISTPVNINIFVQIGTYWFPALTHGSDGVNVITYVIHDGDKLEIDSTLAGAFIYIIDYV